MTLYASEKASGHTYSKKELGIAAAHEFGHILGINDGYNNEKTKEYNSIMCDPWGYRHGKKKASSKDIKKALDAYKKNKEQSWK